MSGRVANSTVRRRKVSRGWIVESRTAWMPGLQCALIAHETDFSGNGTAGLARIDALYFQAVDAGMLVENVDHRL
jgi:hypothetical protein